MKIIKRVSLYRAVQRLGDPPADASIMEHASNKKTAPWKMPIDYELVKYGYMSKPRTYTMGILGVVALLVGFAASTAEHELRNNEIRTIYSYRLKQTMQPIALLMFRRFFFWFISECVGAQLFPFYQFQQLFGIISQVEQRHIRHMQYQYYVKHRDDKYDFMDLGVLQKFPYPITSREK